MWLRKAAADERCRVIDLQWLLCRRGALSCIRATPAEPLVRSAAWGSMDLTPTVVDPGLVCDVGGWFELEGGVLDVEVAAQTRLNLVQ